MADPCVLGIDLGTSSCKVTAVLTDGTVLAAARREYSTHTSRDGWAEQDPDAWLPAVTDAIRELTVEGAAGDVDVAGMGLTSAAHVTVVLDASGRPARHAILWSDTRSAEDARRISDEIGTIVTEATYNAPSATWSLSHLAWVKRSEPEVWSRVAQVCLSKDYLLRSLTGSFLTDRGTATSSLLFDARNDRWSGDICAWLGLATDQLPAVAPVRNIVGRLSSDSARALGLAEGTPIVNGSLDSATETYATGACRPGATVIRLGTAGGIHVVSDEPFPDRRLITYPHPDEPLWYSQAGTSAAGASIEWARSSLGGGRVLSYDELERLAASSDAGAGGVVFHPYLNGERCPYWDSSLRGSFTGLSARHGSPHLARAVVEGVALSLVDAYSVFESCGVEPGLTTVVGGGCRSPLLLSVLSTVFGRPLLVQEHVDSSYGAALLAMEAVIPGQPAVIAKVGQGATIEPEKSLVTTYRRLAEEYASWVPRLQGG